MEFKRIAQCRFLIGATSAAWPMNGDGGFSRRNDGAGGGKRTPSFRNFVSNAREKYTQITGIAFQCCGKHIRGIAQFLSFIGCGYTGGTWVCYTVDICSRISQLLRRFHFGMCQSLEQVLANRRWRFIPNRIFLHHVDGVLECRRISQT